MSEASFPFCCLNRLRPFALPGRHQKGKLKRSSCRGTWSPSSLFLRNVSVTAAAPAPAGLGAPRRVSRMRWNPLASAESGLPRIKIPLQKQLRAQATLWTGIALDRKPHVSQGTRSWHQPRTPDLMCTHHSFVKWLHNHGGCYAFLIVEESLTPSE